MTPALYASSDYAAALSALMPRGRVWSTDPSSTQQLTLATFAPTAERLDAAAQQLLVDAVPSTTVNLITEWEESLGLVVQDAGLTLQQRQAAVVARLVEVGGQAQADMIAYAATLGATISIQTYAPFRCGFNTCGQPLNGPAWAFAWSIHIIANTGQLTSAALLAAIEAIAPAETTVFLN